MSDVVERAKAALEGVTEGPWGNYGNAPFEVFQEPEVGQEYIAPRVYALADAQFISRARSLVPELVAELEHLRGLQRDDRATAIAAIAERDAANAEVERLRAIVAGVQEELTNITDDEFYDRIAAVPGLLQ